MTISEKILFIRERSFTAKENLSFSISLADVLRAVNEGIRPVDYPMLAVGAAGIFLNIYTEDETWEFARREFEHETVAWDFALTLEKQSNKVIDFLYERFL